MKHIFLVGAKSPGFYGGYETFVYQLIRAHEKNNRIKYHVACKTSGDGKEYIENFPEHTELQHKGKKVRSFTLHGADCQVIHVPNVGPAQAILYDLRALKRMCKIIKKEKLHQGVVYIMACRIGPFMGHYKRKLHRMGIKVYLNPDGHEWRRSKWSKPVRKYWKHSEKLMVKHADHIICDSLNIEKYIRMTYEDYQPSTGYIAYGANLPEGKDARGNSEALVKWLSERHLQPEEYYLMVGRFVPENNYEVVLREFIYSHTKKKLVIITTENEKFKKELEEKYAFHRDSRICFAGTVYNQELLQEIRENAYAYIHGHEVGGTNPSLLEAMACTQLNLLINVSFNREVGEEACLYWGKEEGNLGGLIDKVDQLGHRELDRYREMSRKRIEEAYTWEYIANRYYTTFVEKLD